MSIARSIRSFLGEPGHIHVAVFHRGAAIITSANLDTSLERPDFVGLVTKAPATEWRGQVPLANGYASYITQRATQAAAVKAVRAEARLVKAEAAREASDPAYALEKALKGYDWYHMMSDDGRVHRAGATHWDKIQALKAQVDPETAETLFAKYASLGRLR